MTDLDTEAKALYERNTNGAAPRWEILGEVTKGVWREEVQRREMYQQLREQTGYPILDCKKALYFFKGDMAKAAEFLSAGHADFGKMITRR